MKKCLESIAILLSIILLLQVAPLTVLETSAAEASAPLDLASKANPEIVKEIESKRTEKTKHFLMSDGSYMAVQYDEPIHYEDANGKWKDYNFHLNLEDAALSEELQAYFNQNKELSYRIARRARSISMFEVENEGVEISWGYKGCNLSRASIVEETQPENGNNRFLYLHNLHGKACYQNIYPNVDLQVDASCNGIKENLILKNKNAASQFVLKYTDGALTPEQVDEQTISFKNDDGQTVFVVTAPVVYDANGQQSKDAISLSLNNVRLMTCEITVSVDKGWLNYAAYPVTVDPTLVINSQFNSSATFVGKTVSANSTYHNATKYQVGSYGSAGKCRTYFQFHIPELDADSRVTGAYVYLKVSDCGGASNQYFNVSRVKSAWPSDMNWANKPEVEEHPIDCLPMHTGEYRLDLSKEAYNWYVHEKDIQQGYANYGICLSGKNESAACYMKIYNETDANGTNKPVLTVSYVSTNGLEPYFTYDSKQAGNHGSASVNLYTGNLALQEILCSENGNRMPVTLTLTYNSADSQFSLNQNGKIGKGFRLNFHQSLERFFPESNPYEGNMQDMFYFRWTDGDGTSHYFKRKKIRIPDVNGKTRLEIVPNEYIDDDGYDLTLTKSGANYLIKAADGSGSEFEYMGAPLDSYRLIRQFDNHNNSITYTYSFGMNNYKRVTNIVDGAGRNIGLTYYDNPLTGQELIKHIVMPNQDTITFSHDSQNRLTSITYPDGDVTTYSYSSSAAEGLLNSVKSSFSNTTTKVFYDGERVSEIRFSNHDGHNQHWGSSTRYLYGSNLTTQVLYKTYANDTAEKEIKTVYAFDTCGRAISVVGDDNYQQTVSFTTNSDTEKRAFATNKLKSESSGIGYVNNLLINTSAENTLTRSIWESPSNNGTQSIESETGLSYGERRQYLGLKSYKISNSSDTFKSGYYAQSYVLPADHASSYTFSAYVKTANVTVDANATEKNGAVLQISFYDASNQRISYMRSSALRGTNGWQRMDVQAVVPQNAASIRVYVGMSMAKGTMWSDCWQLEAGETVNPYNCIENSNFKSGSAWNKTGFANSDSIGNGAVRISGTIPSADKYAWQEIKIGKKMPSLFVSSRADAQSAPFSSLQGRRFGVELNIIYEGNQSPNSEKHFVSFDDTTSALQQAGKTVIPKEVDRVVKSVQYRLVYDKNINSACFYTAMLSLDENGVNYAYEDFQMKNDDNVQVIGTKITAIDSSGRSTVTVLDENNREYYIQDVSDKMSDINYTDANDIRSKRTVQHLSDTEGKGTYYEYDQYGNVIASKTGLINQYGQIQYNPSIRSYYTYDSTGNYMVSKSDGLGNTVSYNIDPLDGRLNSVTDANGNQTTYTFSEQSQLMTDMTRGNASVHYDYNDKHQLTQLQHNGFSYVIDYDRWGQQKSVSVGSRALSLNTYDANTRRLMKTTYGNGYQIDYEYDKYGRTTSIQKGSLPSDQLSVVYNKSGQIASQNDGGEKTKYYYDGTGRLVSSRSESTQNVSHQYEYDKLNRLISEKGTHGALDYCYEASYNWDGTLDIVQENGMYTSYAYDDFNRITRKTTGTPYHARSLFTDITYVNGPIENDGSVRTARISKISYNAAGNSDVLEYTYDANGNILSITKNGAPYVSYVYDGLNQLVRENHAAANKTWVYSYDHAGNILTKTEYAFTTGALSTVLSCKNYLYGDSEWHDLLTSYNGQSITYDSIGNPTNYRGRQMTWNGRQLKQVTAEGKNDVRFVYSASGLRMEKKYGADTVRYFYDDAGCLIAQQKNNDAPMVFCRNLSTGEIDGFTYNGGTYWYRKNQQDDVTGIFNTNYGATELFVEYEYDAWGNIISITGTGADTIGQLNPMRYRGYYYDTETGFYDLQSRYYDPETGRFLNADMFASTGQGVLGTNMFAYCGNNPVNLSDPFGDYAIDPREYWAMMQQYGEGAANGWARDAMAYMNAVESRISLGENHDTEEVQFSNPDFSSSYYTNENWYFENGYQYQCTWYCYGRALERTGKRMPIYSAVSWPNNILEGKLVNEICTCSIAVFKGTNGKNPNGHVVFIEKWNPTTRMVTFSEANIDRKHYNGILTMDYDSFIRRYEVRNLELYVYIKL